MKLLPTLFAWLIALTATAQPVTLDFDRATNHTSSITYAFKYWPMGGSQTNRIDLGTNRTSTLTNGPWGPLNVQAVAVAYGTNGTNVVTVDSDPSNTVALTNRPSAPLMLRVTEGTNAVQIEGTFNGGSTWKTLAFVTNEPAMILGAAQSMMLRAKRIQPPPLP